MQQLAGINEVKKPDSPLERELGVVFLNLTDAMKELKKAKATASLADKAIAKKVDSALKSVESTIKDIRKKLGKQ